MSEGVDAWIDGLEPGQVLLHARRPDPLDGRGASFAFRDPLRVHRLATASDPRPLLRTLQAELDAGYAVAGYLSYEAGLALLGVDDAPTPPHAAAWFGVYDRFERRDQPEPVRPAATLGFEPHEAQWDWNLERWTAAVESVRTALTAGESYQANLVTRLTLPVPDALAAYRTLSASQPTAYGALLDDGEVRILSASPELFLRVAPTGDGPPKVWTRPMKGTAPRHGDQEQDDRAAAALAADPKSRAENVMIVDLLRNDLGRVALPGSVRVPDLFRVERYRSVLQLTSTVEAQLAPDVGLAELLAATFPCGSITGAPKHRTVRLLRALEQRARGVYTGAIGYALPNPGGGLGEVAFSVAIRTLTVQQGTGTFGVGCGIVIDSDPRSEWQEAQAKARFLLRPSPAPLLIETMRSEQGRIPLLPRHLARLERSAAWFGVPFAAAAVQRFAERAAAAAGPLARLRLTLDERGTVRAEATPWRERPASAGPLQVAWADQPIDEHDPRQAHKSSDRARYDAASAWAARAGVDEVLFRNRAGRLAEGAISTLFVRLPGERVWRTPPTSDGALPGVLRSRLLEAGEAVTAPLRPEDLAGAEVRFGNALRGLQPARLVDAPRFAPPDDPVSGCA